MVSGHHLWTPFSFSSIRQKKKKGRQKEKGRRKEGEGKEVVLVRGSVGGDILPSQLISHAKLVYASAWSGLWLVWCLYSGRKGAVYSVMPHSFLSSLCITVSNS